MSFKAIELGVAATPSIIFFAGVIFGAIATLRGNRSNAGISKLGNFVVIATGITLLILTGASVTAQVSGQPLAFADVAPSAVAMASFFAASLVLLVALHERIGIGLMAAAFTVALFFGSLFFLLALFVGPRLIGLNQSLAVL